jgi:hypothetical protein
MIKRENVEIRDQAHEMWAEGCQDEKPVFSEITELLESEGFKHDWIESHFDSMQGLWRWICDIERK